MIFEVLQQAAENRELILVDGGICDYHLRRDGQITIREIIVLPERQRQGIGTAMLEQLKALKSKSIFAKCPADLPSNGWYSHSGFQLEGEETTRSGRKINLWRLIVGK